MFLDVLTVLVERVRCIPAGGAVMDIHALRIICVILSYLNVVHLYRLFCYILNSNNTNVCITVIKYDSASCIVNRGVSTPVYFM